MQTVDISPASMSRFEQVIGPERSRAFEALADQAREHLQGRVIWNVNATATGGGVAEMLQVLLAYVQGVGVDARWLTLEGEPTFFATTKRIHNLIHGMPGDGGPLGDAERQNYDEVLARNIESVKHLFKPEDIMLLHDPQTTGMIPAMKELGMKVIWRCHIGRDKPNEETAKVWNWLAPYLEQADSVIVHRPEYIPPSVPKEKVSIIAPSIDPLATKNADVDPKNMEQTLVRIGVLQGTDEGQTIEFLRRDNSTGTIKPGILAEVVGGPVPTGVPVVLQVSRWDRLKDMDGVMRGFVDAKDIPDNAHLVLCGPDVSGVTDDPEGAEVFKECQNIWAALPESVRDRVHLVCLPMHDVDENAHMVNALQRYATVVVQKSLFEGFGLTVTEAMWKARPMVASAVGGIQDQIIDGECGLLLPEPQDLTGFGQRVGQLLNDPEYAEKLGNAAKERVFNVYLEDRHLMQYGQLLGQL